MSYWTYVYGTFSLSGDSSYQDILTEALKGNEYFKNTKQVFPKTINTQNILNALTQFEDDEKEVEDYPEEDWPTTTSYKFSHLNYDGITLKDKNDVAVEIPFLPPPPIGSEGGLHFNISYDNDWRIHNVVVRGGIRDYDKEMTPYIEWWFKTVSAFVGEPALFYYEVTLKKPVVKQCSFNDGERAAIITEYLNILEKWIDKCKDYMKSEHKFLEEHTSDEQKSDLYLFECEHRPDWEEHVLDYLKKNKKYNSSES